MISKIPDIDISWFDALNSEFDSPYFQELQSFLLNEETQHTIFPPTSMIFNAFNHTPLHSVKAVIIGQDPYHGVGQAHGLCFSVPEGVAIPPSLKNIFKEMNDDIGAPMPKSGNLEKWADEGVLLLNSTLTVNSGKAGSHQGRGWERFTDKVIRSISEKRSGVVFVLWGRFAINKAKLIDKSKHTILTAPHPSPLSVYRGFYGCKHFSQTNSILKENGLDPIDWRL